MLTLRAVFPKTRFFMAATIAGLLIIVVLFWRLGSLTPGLSSQEISARNSSSSLSDIADQPLNSPERLVQLLFQKLGHSGAFWMRSASVLFAIIFMACLFYLVQKWFGRLVGLLGIALFAFTPWVIIMARQSEPNILLLAPIAILAAYKWLGSSSRWPWLAWVTFGVVVSLSLYIPGLIWLILIGGVASRKSLSLVAKDSSRSTIAASLLISLIIILPLVFAAAKDLSILRQLLLIPSNLPAPLEMLKSIYWSALALIYRSPTHIPQIIGRLPILDIPQIALMAFGSYVMYSRARPQMYLMFGLLIGGIVLAGLNENLELLTLSLPAAAILIAAGLRYLYLEWRSVFPKNPLPKYLALALMAFLVGVNLIYGVRYALIAWPRSLDTRNTYMLK